MNFIQQAYKGRNEWYHYIITLFVVFIGWQIIGVIPLLLAAISKAANANEFMEAAKDSFMSMGINKNLFLFLIIVSFAFGLLGLFLSVKYIHKRKWKTLLTSRKATDWKRFWFSFLAWGIVSAVVIGVSILLAPETFTWNFKAGPFFTLLLVSFLFLPLQTSFEELLFRGYLMQGIGTWFKNRWVPLLVTSIAFGLLHGANPEVEKLGYIAMVFYIGTGLFYGITTLMDEGTEIALGLHAANNIVAAFFVTTDWMVFKTDALFVDTSEPSVGWEMFFPVFVLYPLMLVLFSKRYKWKHWKAKLFGTIEEPTAIES